jgi:hypothetical protein
MCHTLASGRYYLTRSILRKAPTLIVAVVQSERLLWGHAIVLAISVSSTTNIGREIWRKRPNAIACDFGGCLLRVVI